MPHATPTTPSEFMQLPEVQELTRKIKEASMEAMPPVMDTDLLTGDDVSRVYKARGEMEELRERLRNLAVAHGVVVGE